MASRSWTARRFGGQTVSDGTASLASSGRHILAEFDDESVIVYP